MVCSKSGTSVVFMHDMYPRRHYDAVFKWYDEVQRTGSLVALYKDNHIRKTTILVKI